MTEFNDSEYLKIMSGVPPSAFNTVRSSRSSRGGTQGSPGYGRYELPDRVKSLQEEREFASKHPILDGVFRLLNTVPRLETDLAYKITGVKRSRDNASWVDFLKDSGVSDGTSFVVGLGLDMALDPLFYLSLGTMGAAKGTRLLKYGDDFANILSHGVQETKALTQFTKIAQKADDFGEALSKASKYSIDTDRLKALRGIVDDFEINRLESLHGTLKKLKKGNKLELDNLQDYVHAIQNSPELGTANRKLQNKLINGIVKTKEDFVKANQGLRLAVPLTKSGPLQIKKGIDLASSKKIVDFLEATKIKPLAKKFGEASSEVMKFIPGGKFVLDTAREMKAKGFVGAPKSLFEMLVKGEGLRDFKIKEASSLVRSFQKKYAKMDRPTRTMMDWTLMHIGKNGDLPGDVGKYSDEIIDAYGDVQKFFDKYRKIGVREGIFKAFPNSYLPINTFIEPAQLKNPFQDTLKLDKTRHYDNMFSFLDSHYDALAQGGSKESMAEARAFKKISKRFTEEGVDAFDDKKYLHQVMDFMADAKHMQPIIQAPDMMIDYAVRLNSARFAREFEVMAYNNYSLLETEIPKQLHKWMSNAMGKDSIKDGALRIRDLVNLADSGIDSQKIARVLNSHNITISVPEHITEFIHEASPLGEILKRNVGDDGVVEIGSFLTDAVGRMKKLRGLTSERKFHDEIAAGFNILKQSDNGTIKRTFTKLADEYDPSDLKTSMLSGAAKALKKRFPNLHKAEKAALNKVMKAADDLAEGGIENMKVLEELEPYMSKATKAVEGAGKTMVDGDIVRTLDRDELYKALGLPDNMGWNPAKGQTGKVIQAVEDVIDDAIDSVPALSAKAQKAKKQAGKLLKQFEDAYDETIIDEEPLDFIERLWHNSTTKVKKQNKDMYDAAKAAINQHHTAISKVPVDEPMMAQMMKELDTFNGFLMDGDIARNIKKMRRIIHNPASKLESLPDIVRKFSYATSKWKYAATMLRTFSGFTARNMMSGIFLATASGARRASSFKESFALTFRREGTLAGKFIKTANGQKIPLEQAWEEGIKRQILGGWSSSEIGIKQFLMEAGKDITSEAGRKYRREIARMGELEVDNLTKKMRDILYDIHRMHDEKGTLLSVDILKRSASLAKEASKYGLKHGDFFLRRLNEGVEAQARWWLFLDLLKDGKTFDDAARITRTNLVDYMHLSPNEEFARNTFMPFYTWTARSLPVALKSLVRNPALTKTIGTAKKDIETLSHDSEQIRALAPDYIRDMFSVVLPMDLKSKNGENARVMFAPDLPIFELARIDVNPSRPNWIREGLEPWMHQLHPAKVIFEYFQNKSLFTGDELERFKGELKPANPAMLLLPDDTKELFGMQRINYYGEEIWGVPAKSKYVINTLIPFLRQTESLIPGSQKMKGKSPAEYLIENASKAVGMKFIPIYKNRLLRNLSRRTEMSYKDDLRSYQQRMGKGKVLSTETEAYLKRLEEAQLVD